MSSNSQVKNVTTTASKKRITTTDSDGWVSTKTVHHKSNDKKEPVKVKETTKAEAVSEKPVETETKVEVPTESKGVAIPIAASTPSGGKGYLAALTKGTTVPGAPSKTDDAASVASDSSDESSHPPTPRRLSFSEKEGWTSVKNNRVKKSTAPPRPKRTEAEEKAHRAYISALRVAEDKFLKECLPTDKERVSNLALQLSKIRNFSGTAHEISFAKDFEPVEVDGKPVSFSRAKFARNKFFINRLRAEYMKMFGSADWVSVKESTRSDKPDTLYIRIGNRD